ncbi:MAG TPA: hypothetical protein VGB17_18410 [Pyrinomonadaceae bacterium]|jgi:homoserine dehydrogenase
MKTLNLCFLGFGNVGEALAHLLLRKREEMREQYGIEWIVTGIATRRRGWLVDPEGFRLSAFFGCEAGPEVAPRPGNVRDWLKAARADVLFETTSLNPQTGQPAIDYIRAGLEHGAHVITANKGPIVHGYQELSALARKLGRRFMFESTVADCLPVFSLFREALPLAGLRGFKGIFNSTTGVVIEEMEAGRTFEEGIERAQLLGIAETDPSYDVDGWDATVKVCALANVLMNVPLKTEEVQREGIRDLTPAMLRAAREAGRAFKLVSRATLTDEGRMIATVRPEQVSPPDALANASGTSLLVHFELDVLPGLTLIAHEPDLRSTAYGLLADFINAVRD